jgi:integrase
MESKTRITEIVQQYLGFRRQLGYQLKIEGEELLRFGQFADKIGHHGPITTDLAVQWATLPAKGSRIYHARRLDMVRRLAKHQALFDPHTEIPVKGLLGPSYHPRPTPHIYTDDEIAALLEAASELGPRNGLRPHTFVTLFGLLASTGLRISEALGLHLQDVDLEDGLITVRAGKFKKSRLVPLHPSSTAALRRYFQHRGNRHPHCASASFFLTEHATPQKYHKTFMTFKALREKLGWHGKDTNGPPRIHDLRHTFAVRRLLRWYQQHADVHAKIVALATYLGHVKVSDTYWYLTAVPELLAIVAERFENASRLKGL